MELIINGHRKWIEPEHNTVSKLLESLSLGHKTVIVEHNQNILQKEEHPHITLADKDILEIVHFVGGG